MAKMIMKDWTSIDQQNIGMRLSDMPGARILRIVTMSSTDTHSAEISVKVIICAQTSTPLPDENCGPDSGGYANHPASGIMLKKAQPYNRSPPPRYIQ